MARAQNPTPLPAATVIAEPPPKYAYRLTEFLERRKLGFGKFLDWTYFEKNDGRTLGSLIVGRIPGLRSKKAMGVEKLMSSRDGHACYPQVIVNGVSRIDDFDISTINVTDVLGFEYYTPSTTPPQYNRTGTGAVFVWGVSSGPGCGTAIFWLK